MAILAKRLFDSYPAQDVGNPEIVLASVIELFEHYPAEVVLKAISPVFGIPGKFKFLPRIAEIKGVLDDLMPRQEAPRTYPVFKALPAPDRSARPTYEELIERCARDGLLIGGRRRGATQREITEFRQANNISDEQWNAIPNAK